MKEEIWPRIALITRMKTIIVVVFYYVFYPCYSCYPW